MKRKRPASFERPWDRFAAYRQGPKKPPPVHGIKVSGTGGTWWGVRWLEALRTVLAGQEGRLARGRTYARAGRTHDFEIDEHGVEAKVTGSSARPYDIKIRLSRLSDEVWTRAIAQMAAQAQFAAALLAGEMPRDIDAAFRAADASLFPQKRSELTTSCSCPDNGDPCKHIAATHYVLGEALDRDPFLLFELRGRKKAQVLDALRAARGKGETQSASSGGTSPAALPEVPRVNVGKVTAADYDRPREAMPSLRFSFTAPAAHGAVLRQLGAPASWSAKASPADALSPLVVRAAEAARRLAMSEAVTESPEPAAPLRTPETTRTPHAKAVTPKAVTPKAVTPKAATPKAATPKAVTPKAVTPKAATPKAATPKAATPKAATPKAATPKAAASRTLTAKAATSKPSKKTIAEASTTPAPSVRAVSRAPKKTNRAGLLRKKQ